MDPGSARWRPARIAQSRYALPDRGAVLQEPAHAQVGGEGRPRDRREEPRAGRRITGTRARPPRGGRGRRPHRPACGRSKNSGSRGPRSRGWGRAAPDRRRASTAKANRSPWTAAAVLPARWRGSISPAKIALERDAGQDGEPPAVDVEHDGATPFRLGSTAAGRAGMRAVRRWASVSSGGSSRPASCIRRPGARSAPGPRPPRPAHGRVAVASAPKGAVVGCGAEAAGAKRRGRLAGDVVLTIANGRDPLDRATKPAQPLRHPVGVGVENEPGDQLVADGDDHPGHGWATAAEPGGHVRHLSLPRMGARS